MKLKTLILIYIAYFALEIFYQSFVLSQVPSVSIKIFDIGQGDSILITTLHKKRILIDGGPDFEIDGYIYDEMPFQKCYLDVVILTHPHKDHAEGLNRLLNHCKVGTLFFNKVNYDSKEFTTFVEESVFFNAKPLLAGDKFYLDDVSFTNLWPTSAYIKEKHTNANLYSIALIMDYKDFEAFFEGDAEESVQYLMDFSEVKSVVSHDLNLLKVSHHGSKNGLYGELLTKMRPDISVISVGENNIYGLPNKEMLDFLSNIGSKVYRTDKNGTISISVKTD